MYASYDYHSSRRASAAGVPFADVYYTPSYFVAEGMAESVFAVASGIKKMAKKARHAYMVRKTERELSELEDRVLEDIGVDRGAIKRVAVDATNSFYQFP